jgi:hypothetical protein
MILAGIGIFFSAMVTTVAAQTAPKKKEPEKKEMSAAMSGSSSNSLRKEAVAVSADLTDETFVLGGRFFIQDDVALLGRIGLEMVDVGDNSGTNYRIGVGMRKYLNRTDLAPFVGGNIDLASEYDPGADDDLSGFDLDVNAGLEYFLHKRISVEGEVGILYSDRSDGVDTTTFGTFTSGIGVNAYLR